MTLFRSDETRQWLRHAQEDLAGAEVLIGAHPPLLKLALFHCQQTSEKALKAFLVWHEQPFRRTHDLVTLGDQCTNLDQTLEPIVAPRCNSPSMLQGFATQAKPASQPWKKPDNGWRSRVRFWTQWFSACRKK